MSVNQKLSHLTTSRTNSNLRKITEIVGHSSKVTVWTTAEALVINTNSIRLIFTKGLIMKKVCATMVLKDLNSKRSMHRHRKL
jgi:hypothetical protein